MVDLTTLLFGEGASQRTILEINLQSCFKKHFFLSFFKKSDFIVAIGQIISNLPRLNLQFFPSDLTVENIDDIPYNTTSLKQVMCGHRN